MTNEQEQITEFMKAAGQFPDGQPVVPTMPDLGVDVKIQPDESSHEFLRQ